MAKDMAPALDGFLHTLSPLIGLSGHISLCGWLHSKEALTATSRGNDRMDVILHCASKCDVMVVAVGSNALEIEAIPTGSKILIYAGQLVQADDQCRLMLYDSAYVLCLEASSYGRGVL